MIAKSPKAYSLSIAASTFLVAAWAVRLTVRLALMTSLPSAFSIFFQPASSSLTRAFNVLFSLIRSEIRLLIESAGLADATAVLRLLREPGGRPRRLGVVAAAALELALLRLRAVALARRVVERAGVPAVLARGAALARRLVVARLGAGGVLPSSTLGCSAICNFLRDGRLFGQHKHYPESLRC